MSHKYDNNTKFHAKPQDLIGRKIRGFKFDGDIVNSPNYCSVMDSLIGCVGTIYAISINGNFIVSFGGLTGVKYTYPASLIHEHLVDDDINVDTSPQIIDLSNVEGVEMMVSYDEEYWTCARVVAKFGECYLTKEGDYVYAKPIEPIKKVTMQQVEQMFGCKVEILK